MNERDNELEKQVTARTAERHDFVVKHTLVSDLICGVLALLTTFLIWLGTSV